MPEERGQTPTDILTMEQAREELSELFTQEIRYNALRRLIPLREWPICLHESADIEDVREARLRERIADKNDRRAHDAGEHSKEEDKALYQELSERLRKANEDDLLRNAMYGEPSIEWSRGAIEAAAAKEIEKMDQEDDEGRRVIHRMNCSTYAWLLKIPAGKNDQETAEQLRSHLGIARPQADQPQELPDASESPLW